jgi:hypothetical protein
VGNFIDGGILIQFHPMTALFLFQEATFLGLEGTYDFSCYVSSCEFRCAVVSEQVHVHHSMQQNISGAFLDASTPTGKYIKSVEF